MRTHTICLAAAACTAALCLPAQAVEVFGGVGTAGFELGAVKKLGESTGIHVEGEIFNYKYTVKEDDANYDARIKFNTIGVYGNYFLSERFRLTGGLVLGSRKVNGTAVSTTGNTIEVNNQTYPVLPGDSVTIDVKFPSASPYLGIGFGHADNGPGVGFYFDVGAIIGKPKVKVQANGSLATTVSQSDLDAEQAKLQKDMNKLRAYPVIKFGLTVGF